jgi:thiaminase (transcriptional activator TenA)
MITPDLITPDSMTLDSMPSKAMPSDAMTNAQSLWQANQDLAAACLAHPFVQGLADGSLPKATFADYVGQDAFFLNAFARAYSIAAAKAPDAEGFEAFYTLAGGVLTELKLHRGYAAQWGVDLAAVCPGSATRRYTDFLLATAWSQDVGSTAAAMAPCMRLYAFLGQSLAQRSPIPHAYSDWIATYSSPEFEQLAQQLETLVNTFTPRSADAHAVYRYAMQCEYDFFAAAGKPW